MSSRMGYGASRRVSRRPEADHPTCLRGWNGYGLEFDRQNQLADLRPFATTPAARRGRVDVGRVQSTPNGVAEFASYCVKGIGDVVGQTAHRGDRSQADDCRYQGVLDQVLTGFVPQ